METKRETRPQARTRIASKVAAISNNLERLDERARGWYIPKGAGLMRRGRVRISGQISVPVVYEFLRSEGEGSVGRKMRNTKKGVNVGRNESARRRMNRGGLINEIGVEDWRVIDECGGISL